MPLNNIHGALQCQAKPNEPNVPQGPYEGSCQGCKTGVVTNRDQSQKRILTCTHCGTADGNMRPARYELERCMMHPEAILDNQNGILTCIGIGNHHDVPQGPYHDSCQGCYVDPDKPNVLSCSHCRSAAGQQLPAAIKFTDCHREKQVVDNNNGQLVCK